MVPYNWKRKRKRIKINRFHSTDFNCYQKLFQQITKYSVEAMFFFRFCKLPNVSYQQVKFDIVSPNMSHLSKYDNDEASDRCGDTAAHDIKSNVTFSVQM